MKENNNNILEKYNLTITEGARYFNIGEKKLRRIIAEHPEFVLMNGTKTLIKKRKFEQFIDDTSSI